ncbi:hypothetical protein ACH9D2_15325 [Kocuria sp. M4R2S49]|uniref:hypothetical protein n=1 Tax=Kocuria rhizosphaericola TaxID=3376284 RepID=UPI00378DAB33
MDSPLDTTVARVPITVRCLGAHGRTVSLSARTLGRGSTDLQDLLRRAYAAVRGDCPSETVTVAFLEDCQGQLQLEYLVVGRTRPSRWRRNRERRRAKDIQAALMEATIVVTLAVETTGAVAAATTARWSESDTPDFVDVVLDGERTVRVPGAVRGMLRDETVLELLRGTLAMFLDDDVEQLVIGKDPDLPGRYQETVVTRSPALVRFLEGAPLASLETGGQEKS